MNLIANGLDLQQEKAIYELTLKKQRSKKSTISSKQMAAMQQLASELMTLRKESHSLMDHNQNHRHDHYPHADKANNQSSPSCNSAASRAQRPKHLNNNQLCRYTKSTTSSSFISNSSTASSSSAMSDETSVKLIQLRLEQLNNELERRLHQYEYLVEQEKAILSAYKMDLFANESVNNFHIVSRVAH